MTRAHVSTSSNRRPGHLLMGANTCDSVALPALPLPIVEQPPRFLPTARVPSWLMQRPLERRFGAAVIDAQLHGACRAHSAGRGAHRARSASGSITAAAIGTSCSRRPRPATSSEIGRKLGAASCDGDVSMGLLVRCGSSIVALQTRCGERQGFPSGLAAPTSCQESTSFERPGWS